tara:strand:- start:128 stop:799 length:672 start_codon:yes stop_codon:yes gene_type:complete
MEIKTEAGQRWVLQDEHGQSVPTGTFLKSNRDEQEGRRFELQGGRPPHKPSSTGRVYGKWSAVDDNVDVVLGANSEYYPQVFNLAWVDRSPIPTADSSEKTDEPSGQLIGVIITAMINDGIKKGIDAAMAAQREDLKTLVAATLTDLVAEMEKTAFDADDHADDIRDVVLDSFEIDDHFDITNYRDEIAEIAKEDMGDISDNVRAAIDDLIDTGKLALTLSNY